MWKKRSKTGRKASWKTKAQVELATLELVSWFNHYRLLEPGYIVILPLSSMRLSNSSAGTGFENKLPCP
jgi:hypothetical protein